MQDEDREAEGERDRTPRADHRAVESERPTLEYERRQEHRSVFDVVVEIFGLAILLLSFLFLLVFIFFGIADLLLH